MWIAFLVVFWIVLMGTVWHLVRKHKESQRTEGRRLFAEAVRAHLIRGDLDPNSVKSFGKQFMLSAEDQQEVLERIFTGVVRNAYRDYRVTDVERERMSEVSQRMGLTDATSRAIERGVQKGTYKKVLNEALADGTISESEGRQLRAIRRRFGIGETKTISLAVVSKVRAHLKSVLEESLESGTLTAVDKDRFERIAMDLGADPRDAAREFSELGADAYRRFAAFAASDDNITPQQQQQLESLKKYFRFPPEVVAAADNLLEETREIMRIRGGELPVASATIGLRNAEKCRVNENAEWISLKKLRSGKNYSWEYGQFTVTDSRVILDGRRQNIDLEARKVRDTALSRDHLVLDLGSRGTQVIRIDEARISKAIVDYVRRPKEFDRQVPDERDRSRYILAEVRRSVWERDGGRCVECSSFEYLEFDHVIPFSRGGSNSEKNIQILCRPCNRSKSDTI